MLTDDSLMPFGAHEGKRFGDVHDSYWLWFLEQPWAASRGEMFEYAKSRVPEKEPPAQPAKAEKPANPAKRKKKEKPVYVLPEVTEPGMLAPWEE